MRNRITSLALGVLCLSCASKSVPPKSAPLQPTKPAPASVAPEATSEVVMHIEKSIRDACGVSEAKTFFAFDSAVILQADLPLMEKLSNCFEGGALDGRNLNIVGFTDPRGEDAYNWDLGEQRAQSVKELLTSGGVKDSRIHVSSRGERDATGYDEAGWSKDRRVDLSLRD